ncbi:MAG: hypothetical protein ACYS72_05085 [Planctomycetota bacterium]
MGVFQKNIKTAVNNQAYWLYAEEILCKNTADKGNPVYDQNQRRIVTFDHSEGALAGEGARYAGGIISSAIDGIKIAEVISGKPSKMASNTLQGSKFPPAT